MIKSLVDNTQPTPANSAVTNQDFIISVAISVPLRRVFDYKLSANTAITPQVGMRVKVPFGQSSKIGIIHQITSTEDYDANRAVNKKSATKPITSGYPAQQSSLALSHNESHPSDGTEHRQSITLKTISLIIDEKPLLPASLIKLYQWIAKYYHAPYGEIWQTMLPSALLKGKPTEYTRPSRWQITPLGKQQITQGLLAKNAVKQKLTLEHLASTSEGISHDQISHLNMTYNHLKTLAGKKWIERIYPKNAAKISESSFKIPQSIQLNSQQNVAIETVKQSLSQYQTFLLFGVTASGKTEVYLRLIQSVLQQGKQALVLVPEIGLTPQTLKRFQDRFAVDIVLLHSGMSEQQRLQSWLKASNNDAQIIIGTRSALFVPLKYPGIIIIDEEHDLSFRQQQGFRYSARDVAMVRANLEQIPVVLGSASPSIETMMNVQKNKVTQLNLTQKAQNSTALTYKVIDLKKQVLNNGLSVELIKTIKTHLNNQGQVLLFLNRRGYAPVLLCHECGWSASCTRCDTHFTYHFQNHYLQCHHCGSNRRAPHQCPTCQCDEMVPVGLGTERLHETITQLFPDHQIARIDRDTTRKKMAMQGFVESIKAGDIDILIGTQMLAKGHHFPNVTLVALIDMDGALYSADFRAPEYAAQLITQVSGRAGRADKPGEVLIQTHHAEHSMLHQVIHEGYAEFAQSAIQERVEAELPPHAFAAMFQAESPQLPQVKSFLQDVTQILDRYSDLKVELLGPAPALYVKKAGKFRYQLFLQTTNRNQLHQLLDLTLTDIEKLKSASRVRWRLEVDPVGDS